jgi:hypothetical protein
VGLKKSRTNAGERLDVKRIADLVCNVVTLLTINYSAAR